jgi:hypothetical protein
MFETSLFVVALLYCSSSSVEAPLKINGSPFNTRPIYFGLNSFTIVEEA